jgi:ribosome-associated protein
MLLPWETSLLDGASASEFPAPPHRYTAPLTFHYLAESFKGDRGLGVRRPAGYTGAGSARRPTRLTSLEQARRIAALAQEKLAKDVVILDMRPVCTYTDYFVLCTGQNPRQTKAIYDEVHARMKVDDGLLPRSVEGVNEARWIVADYLDLVLHVFTPDARSFYRLEDLWGDVPQMELAEATG